jgi:hypothetical protein
LTKNCECCGKEFDGHPTKKYCSGQCKRRAKYERLDKPRRQIKGYGIRSYTYICKQCGKEYHPKEKDRDKYCSRECFFEFISKRGKSVIANKEQRKEAWIKKIETQKYLTLLRNDITKAMNEELKTKTYICQLCGKKFDSCRKKRACSDGCERKLKNRLATSYHEVRKRGFKKNGIVDNTITLNKLILKHKGICGICGKSVDVNDCKYDKQGNFIVGNNYPTIDHIQPRVKGGTHTWGNVQLAHLKCNSIKNDKVYSPLKNSSIFTINTACRPCFFPKLKHYKRGLYCDRQKSAYHRRPDQG